MQKKYVFLVVVALVVILLDQYTKFLTLDRLTGAFDGATSKAGVFFGSAPEAGWDSYHFRPKDAVTLSRTTHRR